MSDKRELSLLYLLQIAHGLGSTYPDIRLTVTRLLVLRPSAIRGNSAKLASRRFSKSISNLSKAGRLEMLPLCYRRGLLRYT